MSLLFERGSPQPLPLLEGMEQLFDPRDPSLCKVKGVIFLARQRFVKEQFGDAEFQEVLARLGPKTRTFAETPLVGSWREFASLVELDRAIYEQFRMRYPHILSLVGAASAEYSIGNVYPILYNKELVSFLERISFFHEQYQKYGRVVFKRTPGGAQMAYYDHPCFSPFFCASGIGFFLEVILRHGGREPKVEEKKCNCRGNGVCIYELEWS